MHKVKKTAKAAARQVGKERVTIEVPDEPLFARYYRFTAEMGGRCVGHVFAYLIANHESEMEDKCYIYVHDLVVDEHARGQGIGRKLMQEVLRLAAREHCYKIVANSHRKRVAARALYAGMGFVPHGREFRLDC